MTNYKTAIFIHLAAILSASCGVSEESDSIPTESQDDQELYGLGTVAKRWPDGEVPVCWTDSSDHPELQAKVRSILQNTWSKAANIHFNFVSQQCNLYPSGVRATVTFSKDLDFRGSSVGLGYSAPDITLMSGYDTRQRRERFQYEVIHEFGHALGFAHEMKRPDNWNGNTPLHCGTGIDQNSSEFSQYAQQSGGINLTASYDDDSVMNYCNPAGFPIVLSAGDVAGARRTDAYGSPPLQTAADILWRNNDGTVVLWLMNGRSATGGVIGVAVNPGAQWHIKGTGDFDADGKTDILWQNDNGEVRFWFMDGATIVAAESAPVAPGNDWHIEGVGDFNGDWISDILWRNNDGTTVLWLMTGRSATGQIIGTSQSLGNQWHISGTGDFDHDGRSDILWRHDNGQARFWFMDGEVVLSSPNAAATTGTDWHVEGFGDFNGDLNSDILWRNNDGTVTLWFMKGRSGAGTIATSTVNPGSQWHIAGANDFDADGKTDILWRNDNGEIRFWFMDAATIVAAESAPPAPGRDWNIQGTGNFNP